MRVTRVFVSALGCTFCAYSFGFGQGGVCVREEAEVGVAEGEGSYDGGCGKCDDGDDDNNYDDAFSDDHDDDDDDDVAAAAAAAADDDDDDGWLWVNSQTSEGAYRASDLQVTLSH